MTPLDRILDGLEAAWIAAADLDPDDHPDTGPDSLNYLLWQAGQFVEQHRPGLVDRLLAGIDDGDAA